MLILPLPKNSSPTGEQATSSEQQMASNSLTGADSENKSSNNNQSTVSFSNYNQADVINNVETAAVTGANNASYNTGPGEVSNGNATVNTQEVNVANTNAYGGEETFWLVLVNKMGQWVGSIIGQESGTTIAGNLVVGQSSDPIPEFESANPQQSANMITGPDSTNNSTVNNQNSMIINNQNDAKIINNVKVTADTGNNSGSYNTLGGDIDAGDATVGLSLVNFVNNNLVGKKLIVVVVDVIGNWFGDIVPPDQEKEKNNSDNNSSGGVILGASIVPQQEDDQGGLLGSDGFGATYSDTPQQVDPKLLSNHYSYSSLNRGSFGTGPLDKLDSLETSGLKRGLFFSPVFAKETQDSNNFSEGTEVTTDWLYVLLPSMLGVLVSKSRKLRTALFTYF